MNERDVAHLILGYAKEIGDIRFRGTEGYLEDLDELKRKMTVKAEEILTPRSFAPDDPGHFFPGDRQIGRRRVVVERRRSRLAAA